LREVLGQDVLLRFGLLSDADAEFDGLYVSDVAVRLYRDTLAQRTNTLLAQPRLTPNNLRIGSDINIEFPLSNETQTDAIIYNVLGQVVFAATGVAIASDGIATLRPALFAGGIYFVEVRTASGLRTRMALMLS
jgi:hypothetical protein